MNTPEYLLELSYGYAASEVLFTACDLGVFNLLNGRSMTSSEIASTLNTDTRATKIFLDALVSLNLLDCHDGNYRNTELSSRHLSKKGDSFLGNTIKHNRSLSDLWLKLKESLRTGQPVHPPDEDEQTTKKRSRDFMLALEDRAAIISKEVIKKFPLKGDEKLLDLGCGPGTYARAFLKRYPRLDIDAADISLALEVAKELAGKENLTDRINFIEGDFLKMKLKENHYDIVFLSHVIHIYDSETNLAICRKTAAALKRGGKLVINDFILRHAGLTHDVGELNGQAHGKGRSSRAWPYLFSLLMLLGSCGGMNYTFDEVSGWMQRAGLSEIEERELVLYSSLVIGKKLEYSGKGQDVVSHLPNQEE